MTTEVDNRMSLKQMFTEMIALNSVDNEIAAEIYFYVFLGAYLKGSYISDGISNKDLRVSFTCIQTSRTGKGRMNKVMKKICDSCGIRCVIITDYTSAGIIGTISQEAISHNEKYAEHGLSESNPEVIVNVKGKEKVIKWQNPVIKGDAGTEDIIIFDELKMLLEPTKENQQILLCLQPALDTPPHIRKKLRSDIAIEYSNPVSIIGTTFPFMSMNKIIATAGYLQRTFVLIRKLSMEQILEMREKQKAIMRPESQVEFDALLKVFCKRLQQIDNSPKVLSITKEAKDELTKMTKYFFERIASTKGANREALLSFSNTVEETALKIAGQHVVMYKKNTIDAQDIRRSYDLVRTFMDILLDKVNITEDKEDSIMITSIISIYKKTIKQNAVDKINHAQFIEAINKSMTMGRNRAGRIIKQLTEDGHFIREKGDKNSVWYKLNDA